MKPANDKWGFRAEGSEQINLDKADSSLYRRLLNREPGFAVCLFCGSCRATCTSGNEGMNFRLAHLLLQRGETARLKSLTDPCLLCGKCTLVCPRNVNIRAVVYNLKIMLHEPF